MIFLKKAPQLILLTEQTLRTETMNTITERLSFIHLISILGLAVTSVSIAYQDIRESAFTGRSLLNFTIFSLVYVLTSQEHLYTCRTIGGSMLAGTVMAAVSFISKKLAGYAVIGNGDTCLTFPAGLIAGNGKNALNMLAAAFLFAFIPSVICAVFNRVEKRRRPPETPRSRFQEYHAGSCLHVRENSDYSEKENSDRQKKELPFVPFILLGLMAVRTGFFP